MPSFNIEVENSKNQSLEMADDSLPTNTSEQRLVGYEVRSTPPPVVEPQPRITKTQIISVVVLCYVNLINYMDRFTVAGILPDIQDTFQINQAQGGLLQTAFVLVYMIIAPVFGYLGDRYNRKHLMALGVFFWSLTTLVGSFMPNFELFLLFRCLVGVGEASYSTIAPTIISDMFVKDQRSKMLAFFYFAIPVGSGLGYMVGAEVTNIASHHTGAADAWRWGLRVTPVMGAVAVLLLLYVMREPPRGEVEGGQHLQTTNFVSDLKYLFTHKSYVLTTIAFTCVTFVAGALAWWGPTFIQLGVEVQDHPNTNPDSVAFAFGAIAMTAGLVGVPLGSFMGMILRKKMGSADALVCGVGLIISFPLLLVGMYFADTNTVAAYVVVFFGQIFLNLNWAVVSDIVLYIVIPTRRSSAEAFQILFSHALGDAGSPYFVGLVSDALKPMFMNSTGNVTLSSSLVGAFLPSDSFNTTATTLLTTTTPTPDMDDKMAEFLALQASMYLCCSFMLFGSVFFFISCCFITKDKERADRIIAALASMKVPSSGGLLIDSSKLRLLHSSSGDSASSSGGAEPFLTAVGDTPSDGSSTDSSSVGGDPCIAVQPSHRYADDTLPEAEQQTTALLLRV